MSDTIPTSTEVLVAGAGTGGSTAARAAARAGRAVLLVDTGQADEIGHKVCGNALSRGGLEAVARHIDPPSGAEIAQVLDGGTLLLADGRTSIEVEAPGVVVNRVLFGQRLLAEAIAEGAQLIDRCECVSWEERDPPSVRVRRSDGRETVIRASVVIDATGYRGVLTRVDGPTHHETLTRADAGIGYREIVPLVEPLPNPRRGFVALSPKEAPGGYAWVFPMGERLANVGIGASLETTGHDLRGALGRLLEEHAGLSASAPVTAGGGMLPLRRPLASVVGDGFAAVGDAACQANPLHGEGIAPSIIAGALAGQAAALAVRSGDTRARALWPYAASFMRDVGASHAAHEVLRRTVYGLRDDDFDFLCVELGQSGLMLRTIGARGPRLPLSAAIGVAGKLARRPGLFRRLLRVAKLAEEMMETYRAYPEDPDRLQTWIGRVEYNLRTLDHLLGARRPAGSPRGAY